MRRFFIGGRPAADFHRGSARVTKRRYTSLRDKGYEATCNGGASYGVTSSFRGHRYDHRPIAVIGAARHNVSAAF